MAFGFHREQWNELPPLTIHPCRNPLLPPAIYIYIYLSIYIYIYIYMYMYIYIYTRTLYPQHACARRVRCSRPFERSPDIPVYFAHESPTSCPTNQDLSLLLVVTDAARARAQPRVRFRNGVLISFRKITRFLRALYGQSGWRSRACELGVRLV